MTEPAIAPAAPSVDDLQRQLAEMRQRELEREIQQARLEVYVEHPHLRQYGLLEQFQGGPDQIKAFGTKLAEQFPPPAPTPAPLTQQPLTPAAPPPVPLPQAAPQTSVVPTPSPQDILPQQSADVARADEIRLKMEQGLATRAEVLWLSQHAPRREVDLGNGMTGYSGGFVSAMKGLNQ